MTNGLQYTANNKNVNNKNNNNY